MVEVKVAWHKNLSFSGSADSGFTLPLGASSQVGGEEDGFRPMELIAIGLAGCTAMDVISILSKKRQEVTAFEVRVQARQAQEHPKVFTQAVIEYHLTGKNIQESALVRAIELSSVRYCPAQAMLAKVFPIELEYHVYEDEGDSKVRLVTSGKYNPVKK